MYFYVLESPQHPRVRRLEEQILTTLRGFGLAGEVVLANPARPARELARAGLQKRYDTIVAIGGDKLINEVAAVLQSSRATMGIVPIDAHPRVTELIGALDPFVACDSLRQRFVHRADIAFIDPGRYILTEAIISNVGEVPIRVHVDDVAVETTITEFRLTGDGHVTLLNDRLGRSFLERTMQQLSGKAKPAPNQSIFHGQYIKVETARSLPVTSAGETVARTPFVAAVKPGALKLIVQRGIFRPALSPEASE